MSDAAISFDPESGQIVELVAQEVNPDAFQADLDAAQNELNTAAQAHEAALAAVEAAQLKADESEASLDRAKMKLAFQNDRKTAYDKAVADRQAAAEASSTEDADPVDSEAIDVPVHVAGEAQV